MQTRPLSLLPRAIAVGLALVGLPIAHCQIEQSELASISQAMAGDDLAALQEAKNSLHQHVSAATAPGKEDQRRAVEAQLIDQLGKSSTLDTQLWLLRQLEAIGDEASVAPLVQLLAHKNDHLADAARLALQANTSPAAADALLAALDAPSSATRRIGYLQSLAARRHKPALDSIAALHSDPDPPIVAAAIAATGQIGGPKAAKTLATLANGPKGDAKFQAEIALIPLARDFGTLSALALQGENRSLRAAAFARCIELSPGRAAKLLTQALTAPELSHREDLLQIALDASAAPLSRLALKSLPDLAPAEQAAIIGALPRKASPAIEKTILELTDSGNEQLKLQAIEALGHIGSVASMPTLLAAIDSRDRDTRESAAFALARIGDPRLDKALLRSAESGTDPERILAIKALAHRNSPGAVPLLNAIAIKDGPLELRREALAALESIGDASSFATLVSIVVKEGDSRLRRDAQLGLKRMSRRAADPQAAWRAFATGLEATSSDPESRLALLSVVDAASTPEAIEILRAEWAKADASANQAILRALPSWRNWDAGFLLADIIAMPGTTPEVRQAAFDGIGRLILGSDATYNMETKFTLAEKVLSLATIEQESQPILGAFRYSTWRERNFVNANETSAALKQAVLTATEG